MNFFRPKYIPRGKDIFNCVLRLLDAWGVRGSETSLTPIYKFVEEPATNVFCVFPARVGCVALENFADFSVLLF